MRLAILPLVCWCALLVACGDDDSSTRGGPGSAGTGGSDTSTAGNGGTTPQPSPNSGGTAGDSPGGGGIGGGELGGSAGVGGASPEPIPVSKFCGDSIRGETDEQCDDGPGTEADLCSVECKITDALAITPVPPSIARELGRGRHPLSAGPKGTALSFIEADAKPPTLGVVTFDQHGKRTGVTRFGAGKTFLSTANPVTAALPDGSFAVAWTDIDGDGDQLGVALQRVNSSGLVPPGVVRANETTAFSQSNPDLLWTGSELVVAWVDNSEATTGPDLLYRRFDATLTPLASQQTLAAGNASEGSVSLAPFGGSWAAAWRQATGDGDSAIGVKIGPTVWTIGPVVPGAEEDIPAIVELDATHLLAVFAVGTDPGDTGSANVSRLRGAIIDSAVAEPGAIFEINALQSAYVGNLEVPQSQPALSRVGDQIFVAWRSGALTSGGAGQELWLKTMSWSGAPAVLDLSREERSLPRTAKAVGDQRTPALAASPLIPKGALWLAWEDYAGNLHAEQGRTDLVLELAPQPQL